MCKLRAVRSEWRSNAFSVDNDEAEHNTLTWVDYVFYFHITIFNLIQYFFSSVDIIYPNILSDVIFLYTVYSYFIFYFASRSVFEKKNSHIFVLMTYLRVLENKFFNKNETGRKISRLYLLWLAETDVHEHKMEK